MHSWSKPPPLVYVLQSTDADANRFHSDILAKVSDAIIAIDEGQCVTYLNAAAEHQYGVRVADALGRALTNLFETRWIHPADGAEARAALDETGHWRGENIHVKRSGEAIRVESSASRLFAKEGTPAGILFVVRDVTHEKRAEDALAEQARLLDLSFGAISCATLKTASPTGAKALRMRMDYTRGAGLIKTELLKQIFKASE
jgi:PAS domain S-box-containing protein